MKTKWTALCALLLLSGCDLRVRDSDDRHRAEAPRWSVVPASSNPYTTGNPNVSPLYSAWRINNGTGALEFCYYDPGGTVIGTSVSPEKLTCSKPVEATSH